MTGRKTRVLEVPVVLMTLIMAVLTAPVYAASTEDISVTPLDLSRPPSTAEIMAAGQLGGPLYPTHSISDPEEERRVNLSFGEAIQKWNRHEYANAIELFKKHIEEYPDSPWVSEATLHVGCDAMKSPPAISPASGTHMDIPGA